MSVWGYAKSTRCALNSTISLRPLSLSSLSPPPPSPPLSLSRSRTYGDIREDEVVSDVIEDTLPRADAVCRARRGAGELKVEGRKKEDRRKKEEG